MIATIRTRLAAAVLRLAGIAPTHPAAAALLSATILRLAAS